MVGIDEAGRGPLAGPVAVGVVCVPFDFDWSLIPGVGDSKKVSAKNREAVFRRAHTLRKSGLFTFAVVLVGPAVIDRLGITHAVAQGITKGLLTLKLNPDEVEVRLDGLLKAPPEYEAQSTIIKGDQKEKVIGLASILAKVTRDAYMVRIARNYPEYAFDVHKGYGTKLHQQAIFAHGLLSVHRRSFTRRYHESAG